MSWYSKEGAWGRGGQENKMVSLREISWCEDVGLQEDLRNYVGQNMKRKDIFLKRDFPTHARSIPHIRDWRLRYFNIFYTDRNVTLDEVRRLLARSLKDPVNFLKQWQGISRYLGNQKVSSKINQWCPVHRSVNRTTRKLQARRIENCKLYSKHRWKSLFFKKCNISFRFMFYPT